MSDIIYLLEIIGTVAFAISGSVEAIKKRLDIFGVFVCGIITALGGGTIRDILLGSFPPAMFLNYVYLIFAFATSMVTFILVKIFNKRFEKDLAVINKINNLFDALGLGVFTIVGIDAAIKAGFSDNAFFAIFLGVTTGCGGGILRDIILNRIPKIFTDRVYAVASLFGGTLYHILLVRLNAGSIISVSVAMAIIFILRILASVFEWDLPKAY